MASKWRRFRHPPRSRCDTRLLDTPQKSHSSKSQSQTTTPYPPARQGSHSPGDIGAMTRPPDTPWGSHSPGDMATSTFPPNVPLDSYSPGNETATLAHRTNFRTATRFRHYSQTPARWICHTKATYLWTRSPEPRFTSLLDTPRTRHWPVNKYQNPYVKTIYTRHDWFLLRILFV